MDRGGSSAPDPDDASVSAAPRTGLGPFAAARPFGVRGDMVNRLSSASAELAGRLGLPREASKMTFAQQHEVYVALDDFVLATDPELWRTKQVNDFLNGVWSVSFGQTYARWITPIVGAWYIARVVGPLWLIAWVTIAVRAAKRRASRGSPSA